jgi:predicted AlkP superfamily phosphohydrolase/phosphomutase
VTVVLLGIDGLDPLVVDRYLPDLPTLRDFAARGTVTKLPSIFPPDSIPAWITIFTGQGPDSHGVLESIDYLASKPAAAVESAPAVLQGRTFWDELSRRGRKVAVVNPFMAYPAWPVNGVMVSGPVFVDEARPTVTPEGAQLGELPQLGGIVDFPDDRTMETFFEESVRTTREQVAFALRLLENENPDFLFVNILTIDRMQHFLWRYVDVDDPTYPGDGRLSDSICKAYIEVDRLIASFTQAVGESGTVIAVSDHGHGRRCTRMLYVDELLRRAGLASTGSFYERTRTQVLESAKRLVLRGAYKFQLEPQAYAVARRVPGRKSLKNSSYSVSSSTSVAQASRLFGRNSSGGVNVRRDLSATDRERAIDAIIGLLSGVRDPAGGEQVCSWIKRREEVVTGTYADRFPDVLFQLKPQFGVDFGVYGPLIGDDPMHRRISGGHRSDGVYIASRSIPNPPRSLQEIYDFVVNLASESP